jgi:hypothetical protein
MDLSHSSHKTAIGVEEIGRKWQIGPMEADSQRSRARRNDKERI